MEYFIQLDIIKLKSDKFFKIINYLLPIFLIILTILLYENAGVILLLPCIIIFLLLFITHDLKNHFYRDYIKIGKMTLYNDQIIISIDGTKKIYLLDEESKIEIKFNEWRGEMNGGKSFGIKSGSNNFITLFNINETYRLLFEFETIKRFNSLLIFWKKANVNYYINQVKQANYIRKI